MRTTNCCACWGMGGSYTADLVAFIPCRACSGAGYTIEHDDTDTQPAYALTDHEGAVLSVVPADAKIERRDDGFYDLV